MAIHRPKIDTLVHARQPIQFVILGFPAKSPNRRKVLGRLPDLGEDIALAFLQSFCDYVRQLYSPRAQLTICSDGHAFSDVVGVSDQDVTDYQQGVSALITEREWDSIAMYSLDDAYGPGPHADKRRLLEEQFAIPREDLRHLITTDGNWRSLFNGTHRFLFEDHASIHQGFSRNQLRKECKELAYQLVQRSNAWSRLVAETFPDAVRLSVHPQPCHSPKIGFHMMPTRDNWLTPWHGVVLYDGVRCSLVKRSEAERMEASLVWRDGRPSHFVTRAYHDRRLFDGGTTCGPAGFLPGASPVGALRTAHRGATCGSS